MDQDLKAQFEADIEEIKAVSQSRIASPLVKVLSLVQQKVGTPTREPSMRGFFATNVPPRIQLRYKGDLLGQIVWTDHKFVVALTSKRDGSFPTKFDIAVFTENAAVPDGEFDRDKRWVAVELSQEKSLAYFVAIFIDNDKSPSEYVTTVMFNPNNLVSAMINTFISTLNNADIYFDGKLIPRSEVQYDGF